MTKFTEGPWFVSDGNPTRYLRGKVCVIDHDGIPTVVAETNRYFSDEMDKANARLIAAAPDLYAVLAKLEESAEYWSEYDVPLGIVNDIKAALAKARGEK